MRNVKIKSGENWNSLSLDYEFDDKIKFSNKVITSADGISLNLSDTLSNCVDISNNNYSTLMMSDLCRLDDLIDLDVNTTDYPEQFTTTLTFDSSPVITTTSKYLKILPRVDDSDERDLIFGEDIIDNVAYDSYYFNQTEDDNDIYFSINLISHDQLTISHNDNYANVYLTLRSDGTFTFRVGTLDEPSSSQIFKYFINKTTGSLILMTEVAGVTSYIGTKAGELSLLTPSIEDPKYPPSSLISIFPYSKTSKRMSIINSWVSYKTTGDLNNLNVNESRSYKDVFNNFIFSNQYSCITGSNMNLDIIQLKNQLTSDSNSTRNNPFPNFIDCDHREYDSIFTGSNQIRGTDNMYLGYNTYTTDITLPTDSITYFHTPQVMYPISKLNVNDSGLIESGAIGGDSPIVSDKLFKKASNYKYNSPHGAPSDEETGVWLCTWLRSSIESIWDGDVEYDRDILVSYNNSVYKSLKRNSNSIPSSDRTSWVEVPEEKPVWVDRYYNPEYYSTQQALEVPDQYTSYASKFEYIVSTLSAEEIYVFDKKSDLVFEPGCLYAYYRIGGSENNTIIDSLRSTLIHEGQSPAYRDDRTIYNNPNRSLTLDGTLYIETESLNKTNNSDYTISVNIGCDDWTKPFGGQIVGNYTNHGIGIFNTMYTTPFIIISNESSTGIYNTNLELIKSIPLSGIQVVHGPGAENIHILHTVNGIYNIAQYDHTGLLVENTPLPDINSTISHINIDGDYMYILDVTNSVYKYNINNEVQDILYKPIPAGVIGDEQLLSTKTYIEIFDEYQYKINCDQYTIDVTGSIWYKKAGNIVKYMPSNQLGSNATYSNTINNISVSLIAEERTRGSDGNNIIIFGDGINTLSFIVGEWNDQNPANKVRIISGDDSKSLIISDNEQIRLIGGIDAGSSTTNIALSSVDCDIAGIKSDIDNNIWLLAKDNQSLTVYKIDSNRNILYKKSLRDINTILNDMVVGNIYLDLISEFKEGEHINNVLILNQNPTDMTSIEVIKLDLDCNFISKNNQTIPQLSTTDINTLHNITNYETVKRMYNDTIERNHIIFKSRLQGYFDTDKTYTQEVKIDVSGLSPGYHHFATAFDATKGITTVFCDGELKQVLRSDDIYTGAAYKFSKTVHDPLLVGTEPFLNNITLSDHLNISNYSTISGVNVDRLRVYNKSLNFHKIRALTREDKDIQPITLSLPTGKRSYIDQVKQIHKHRSAGRKSSDIDISITNITVSGDDIKQLINQKIFKEITDTLSPNSTIRNINWV